MRLRLYFLSVSIILSSLASARADIFINFATVNSPPGTLATPIPNSYTVPTSGTVAGSTSGPTGTTNILNPASVGLTVNVGQTVYVVASLQVDGINNGPNTATWVADASPYTLTQFAMDLTFNPAIANNPYIPRGTPPTGNENNANVMTQSGFSVTYPQEPYPPNYRQIVGLNSAGLLGNLNGNGTVDNTPLIAFKITGTSPGVTTFSLSQFTFGPSGPLSNQIIVSKNVPGTDLPLDNELFDANHPNFGLLVTVVVPEPSSMALAALAAAGFFWRRRANHRRRLSRQPS